MSGTCWSIISDVLPRVRAHKERGERLEQTASEARAALSERRAVLGDVETITADAEERSAFLATRARTESKACIRSFVTEVAVAPGAATIRYTIPMPEDSPLRGSGGPPAVGRVDMASGYRGPLDEHRDQCSKTTKRTVCRSSLGMRCANWLPSRWSGRP